MNAISQPAFSPAHGPAAAPSTDPPRGLQSDYMTFLRMLTVQMQNQDPLNPMEASDFAVQLATFSNVEQATKTNELLEALLGRAGLSELGNWVGMEARVPGQAWFEGEPIQLATDPVLGATRVVLVVRDADGAIVDSRTLDPEAESYSWDGALTAGGTAETGRYSFEIESFRGDELIDTTPAAAYQHVREARVEDGITYLVLPGGLLIDSRMVTGLRQPATVEAAPPDGARLGARLR